MKYLLSILLISITVSAQIGGLSGSKLVSFCVDVVDHHKLEFEPAIGMSSTNQYWNNKSTLKNSFNSTDSISKSSAVQMRITYGLWNTMEMGVTFPIDGSMTNWGIRYIILNDETLAFAAMAGINIPFGNKSYDESLRTEENTKQYGFGLITSYQINDNFSIDANSQLNVYAEELENSLSSSFSFSADAGYYTYEKQLQFILAMNYQQFNMTSMDSYLMTLSPGITVESGENYIIVLNSSIDIAGQNIEKSFGFGMALTLTIN